jgi:ATP-dependent RNA helicase DDX47/RRP3
MGARETDTLTEEERAAAIKAFEELGLCTQLAEAAASLGWKTPSVIQQQAVPPLIKGVPYTLQKTSAAKA